MDSKVLRELQQVILANAECAPFVHTNEMPRVASARDKDQAIADILNRMGVVAETRRAEASDVRRVLILHGAWRNAPADLEDMVLAGLSADYIKEAAHLLDDMLNPDAAAAVRQLCRVPISWELVSRAVRGPWGDEG